MRKALFVIIIVLFVLVGWFLGYINFPFIDQSQSFWVGFTGGLAIMLLVMALIKSRSKLHNLGNTSPKTRLLLPIVMAILFISVLFLFIKNRSLESSVNVLKEQTYQSNSISSSQQAEFLAIMNSLLDTAGNELKRSKNNTLSTSTIGRIAAFSNMIESYQFISADTGIVKKVSPVKGHLLLSLIHMNMDSSSFTQIKRQVSFAGADLSNADLSGFNLEGINLKEASLAHSLLKGTNMSNSNLFGANFYKAQMHDMNLSHSLMEKANLNWSNLTGSILFKANMVYADLRNANLTRTDLREVLFNESLLYLAILVDADLTGSQLTKAVLMAANLSNARLINVALQNSVFSNANLSNTQVDSAWLINLKKWKVNGEEDLVNRYDISLDSAQSCWRLQEKD